MHNDKFSRHAARKPMIARYRPMPRGRPAMTSWNLAENPTIATQILDCRAFDLRPTTTALLQTCERFWVARRQPNYLRTCESFWAARRQPNYCELAKGFGLRGDNRTIANLRQILICAVGPPNHREFATALPATYSLCNAAFASKNLAGSNA